jgi:hypothetical protein
MGKKHVAGFCWSSKPAAVSPAALPVPWQTCVFFTSWVNMRLAPSLVARGDWGGFSCYAQSSPNSYTYSFRS